MSSGASQSCQTNAAAAAASAAVQAASLGSATAAGGVTGQMPAAGNSQHLAAAAAQPAINYAAAAQVYLLCIANSKTNKTIYIHYIFYEKYNISLDQRYFIVCCKYQCAKVLVKQF